MYQARFDERRHATEARNALFTEDILLAAPPASVHGWSRSRTLPSPRFRDRMTRDEARAVLSKTESLGLTYAGPAREFHPLESVDQAHPPTGAAPLGCCEHGDGRALGVEGRPAPVSTITGPRHPRHRNWWAPQERRRILRGLAAPIVCHRMRHRRRHGADPGRRRSNRQRRVRCAVWVSLATGGSH